MVFPSPRLLWHLRLVIIRGFERQTLEIWSCRLESTTVDTTLSTVNHSWVIKGLSWMRVCISLKICLASSWSCNFYSYPIFVGVTILNHTKTPSFGNLFLSLASRWLRAISCCFCYLLSVSFCKEGVIKSCISHLKSTHQMEVVFLFKALWWLLRLLTLCSLERCICRNEPSHLLSWFLLFSLWIQCTCPLYTQVQPWKELCECGVGVGLLHVNSKYVFFPLSTHFTHTHTQLLFCYSMFYFIFPQILAIIDLGLFFSFVSFFRHSNFPSSQDL